MAILKGKQSLHFVNLLTWHLYHIMHHCKKKIPELLLQKPSPELWSAKEHQSSYTKPEVYSYTFFSANTKIQELSQVFLLVSKSVRVRYAFTHEGDGASRQHSCTRLPTRVGLGIRTLHKYWKRTLLPHAWVASEPSCCHPLLPTKWTIGQDFSTYLSNGIPIPELFAVCSCFTVSAITAAEWNKM